MGTGSAASAAGGGAAAPSAPLLYSVAPASGASAGGTTITVGGLNFITSASTVSIGGVDCTSNTVLSGTTMTAVTPAGSLGTAGLQVTTPNGSALSTAGFVYTNTFSISGTVSNASGAAVPGGIVELFSSDTNSLSTTTANASGVYTFAGLVSGTYYPYLHPPLGYGLASSETGSQAVLPTQQGTVTVTTANVTRNFSVVSAIFNSNYNFASTAAVNDGSTGYAEVGWGPGWNGAKHWNNTGRGSSSSFTMLATGGSAGQPCLSTMVSASTDTCCSCSGGQQKTVGLEADVTTYGSGGTNYWLRMRRKMSANYTPGYPGCGTHSHKYQLMHIGNSSGAGGLGSRMMMEVQWNGSQTDHQLHVQMSDSSGYWYTGALGNFDGYRDKWLTWVVQIQGIGASRSTCNVYLNGALTPTLTGSGTFITPGGGNQLTETSPYNFDNGPDVNIAFLDEEISVSLTRPSMYDGLTP